MRVIETLGYHRDEGCRHLDLHLARLQRSAQALEFSIDLTAIRTRLQSIKKTQRHSAVGLPWRKTVTLR